MRKIIRIEWGYCMSYAPQPWHHAEYPMDGALSVENGRISEPEMIEFGVGFGVQREQFHRLERPQWRWRALYPNKRLGGIRFILEGNECTRVDFSTRSFSGSFALGNLIEQKMIVWPVATPRTSHMTVRVLFDGVDPLLDTPAEVEAISRKEGRWRRLLHAREFSGVIHRWFRTDWVWVSPGNPARLMLQKPEWSPVENGGRRFLRANLCVCPAVPDAPAGQEISPAHVPECGRSATLRCRASFNGQTVMQEKRYFAELRNFPLLEELAFDIPEVAFQPDGNELCVEMDTPGTYLLIGRAMLVEVHQFDFQIVASPQWVVQGKPFYLKIRCRRSVRIRKADVPDGIRCLFGLTETLEIGEHRLGFQAEEPLAGARITLRSDGGDSSVTIELVVGAADPAPLRLGLDTLNISWRCPGQIEALIREIADTQTGDFILFRPKEHGDLPPDLAASWGRLCHDYGVYHVAYVYPDQNTEVVRAMRETGSNHFLGVHLQEWDGDLWGYPHRTWAGLEYAMPERQTMKNAEAAHIEFLRRAKQDFLHGNDVSFRATLSAVGHSLAYRADIDVGIAQFNKFHNALLLSDARGAARAHGRTGWGTHIAEGAHLGPEGAYSLRMWRLALQFSYICGASCAYDEESAWRSVHGPPYAPGDRFPRKRREILREFNRYTKTHPRRGRLAVKQALLIGQYACDVTDAADGDRPPRVWGSYAPDTMEWRHGTPEYGWRYLDVFLPGVWLQSLEQSPESVRHWYSGTPHGEIELIPIRTPQEVLSEFKLLLLLGWNTMDAEVYSGLKRYVEQGGTLFLSVPHLTLHEGREFLNRMEDLNLFRGGNFADFLGVQVSGKGDVLTSVQACAESGCRTDQIYPLLDVSRPIHAPVHIAECRIEEDVETLAVDASSRRPVLVRRRHGRGVVYLLLTFDYPGNSRLAVFLMDFFNALARSVKAPVGLDDPSGDIYYTVREDGDARRIHLLNTDWTAVGNARRCRLRLGTTEVPIRVVEGSLIEVVWQENFLILQEDCHIWVESLAIQGRTCTITVRGCGSAVLSVRTLNEGTSCTAWFNGQTVVRDECDGWSRFTLNFSGRSIGDLIVDMV